MKMIETSYESLYDERMERLREISKTDDDVLALLYVRANVVPLRRMFSWAVPNGEALETIQKYSPNGVCEIGAGLGLWAKKLRDKGVDTWAYDKFANKANGYVSGGCNSSNEEEAPPPFCTIEVGGAEKAREHENQSLFLCWPPPEDSRGNAPDVARFVALDALSNYKGNCVLHVGEGENGETDGQKFRKKLHEEFELKDVISIPNWLNAFDRLTVFERRNKGGAQNIESSPPVQTKASNAAREKWNEERVYRLNAQKERWEELCVEHVERKKQNSTSSIFLSSIEREAIEAVKRRSGILRRLVLSRLLL